MAGGGTGGHVIPGHRGGAGSLRGMGYEVLFVGTERGVESRLVPGRGFPPGKHSRRRIKNLGIADAPPEPVAAASQRRCGQ